MSEELKVKTEVKKIIAWKDCEAVIMDGKIHFATVVEFETVAKKELNEDPEGFLRWLTLVVKTLIESRPKPPRKDKGKSHKKKDTILEEEKGVENENKSQD